MRREGNLTVSLDQQYLGTSTLFWVEKVWAASHSMHALCPNFTSNPYAQRPSRRRLWSQIFEYRLGRAGNSAESDEVPKLVLTFDHAIHLLNLPPIEQLCSITPLETKIGWLLDQIQQIHGVVKRKRPI